METDDDNSNETNQTENSVYLQEEDLASILQNLIRGNIRLVSGHSMYNTSYSEEDEDDADDEGFVTPNEPPVEATPNTTNLKKSDFLQEMLERLGDNDATTNFIPKLVAQREFGTRPVSRFDTRDRITLKNSLFPNKSEQLVKYHAKAFCGIYSQSGDIFLSACQDQNIRIYNCSEERFKLMRTIRARDVGWSVLDTAFSPDGNYVAYSSWSEYVHLCNIYGEETTHSALYMDPDNDRSFAIFSIKFSSDNREILGGANDGNLYVFDRERNERMLLIDAHEDDVNAVTFADETSHILFSGGDDGLVKVWDRRTLSEASPLPVGIFAGHTDGITFIDSKVVSFGDKVGDGRYLLSNCKDQTIKLWDMRKFSSFSAQQETKKAVSKQLWDYRWQRVPAYLRKQRLSVAGDSSLMTYRGHNVLHTLVRARFSPLENTGQRYIYTGCASGSVVVFDVLTGEVATRLNAQRACVRDVSWHPFDQNIISTSWDGTLCRWTHSNDDIDVDITSVAAVDASKCCETEPKRQSRYNLRSRVAGLFG